MISPPPPGAVLALVLLGASAGCVNLPRDHAVPSPAAPAIVSNAVRCNCVVNEHRDDARCADPSVCPGPDCPCPGMDFDLCLPPDLNRDTATDPTQKERLARPDFDFDAAVQRYCRDRAQVIMTDIGGVSQHGIICDGKRNDYFTVDTPALINCQAVAFDGRAGTSSTWRSATCARPCGDTACVNGPRSERANANCDGDDVFTSTGLHPEGCHCNRVLAENACNGKESERFCFPPPGEAKERATVDGGP